MNANGLLIVTANPPVHMEEEFNAWYDLEHLAERMAVPGFESGRRYVRMHLERRYLALYEMANAGVVDTPPYLAVSGGLATPWTKRIVAACRFRRFVATQISPSFSGPPAPFITMAILENCDGASALDYVGKRFSAEPGVFRSGVYAEVCASRPKHFVIVESVREISVAANWHDDAIVPTEIGSYAPY
jgi:hypothetical protein